MQKDKDALLDELKLLLDRFFYTMKHVSQESKLKGDLGDGPTFLLFTLIEADRPLRVTEIARNLGLTVGAVTIMCGKLELMGLISRERSDQDRRAVWVQLTQQGADLINTLQENRFSYMRKRLSLMSEADLQRAAQAFEQFIQYLKPE